MEHQRLGSRRLEIRSLPALLPAGTDYLERAVLPPAAVDRDIVALRSYALSMLILPLQFRQLSWVQGAVYVAENSTKWDAGGATDRSKNVEKKWFQVTRPTTRPPAGMHGQNLASDNGVT